MGRGEARSGGARQGKAVRGEGKRGGARRGGVGQGEGATRNFLTNQVAKLPLVFNIKITAPFRQLLTSAKGFYDPTIFIEQNLPALMRAQEEAEAAKKGATAPVQPPESEPVQ